MVSLRIVLVAALAFFANSGCRSPLERDSIPGEYHLNYKGQRAILRIFPNYSYTEVLQQGERVESTFGRWRWDRHSIELDDFLIPDGIVDDNFWGGRSVRRENHGPYQEQWDLETFKTWTGGAKLALSPDLDADFERVY